MSIPVGSSSAGPERGESLSSPAGGDDFNLSILESIRLLQTRFIANHDLREIFNQFILELLRLTSSEYAFVGEVLHAPDGHPYLKIHDISHIARDEATRAFFEGHAPAGAEFHNLNNLFGRAILDRQPVIANQPRQDPRWGGRQPAGHPPMHSFLGLPLMLETEVIGLVGLANSSTGYDEALVAKLQPVLSSCSAIIDSHRNYRRRIQAEQDLKDSSRLFQALVENGTEAILVLARDGISYASPAARSLFGYEPEELLSLGRLPEFHPDDAGAASQRFARMRDGESLDELMEFRLRRKSGEYVWVQAHLTGRLDDPAIQGVVAIFRDISGRKQAEQDLQHSEERLHLAVEAAKLGTWYCDLPLDRIQMNPRCREQFGWSPEEDVDFGKFYSKLHPEDREPTRIVVAEAVAERREYDTHYRVIPFEGADPRWIRAIGKVLHDERGNPRRFYGVCIDVTEARRNEELMRQSQKLEAIGRLAGGIAHDFNNLLTAINGYSDLCLSQLTPDHALHSHLSEIRRSGGRAASLTNQLLAYSRKQMLMPKVIDLNDIVRDMQRMLARIIGEEIRVEIRLGSEASLVKVDPDQLQQAILNLAINGRDAMPEGGTLTLETGRRRIDASSDTPETPPGWYSLLTIGDTGTGIEPAVLPKIFEPFFTTKPVGKGTGLGLSMVYGMVRQSGGQVIVGTQPGRGTKFTLLLPAVTTELPAAPLHEEASPQDGTAGTESILLVEDEAAVLKFLTHALRAKGYRVEPMDSPIKALSWLQSAETPPDLLVTDVVMGGMSGVALATAARERLPGLRVIFMSGYTDDEMLKYGIRENQAVFLQKPFPSQVLLRRIRELLGASSDPQR